MQNLLYVLNSLIAIVIFGFGVYLGGDVVGLLLGTILAGAYGKFSGII